MYYQKLSLLSAQLLILLSTGCSSSHSVNTQLDKALVDEREIYNVLSHTTATPMYTTSKVVDGKLICSEVSVGRSGNSHYIETSDISCQDHHKQHN
ncbi:exported hypothetical protein [Vibrio chagasii]|nr:exported hypothetical protein [Vibrio chagasii]